MRSKFENFRNYFDFNRSERKGIIVVLAIIVIILAYPYLKPNRKHVDNIENNLRFIKEVEQFERNLSKSKDSIIESRKFDFQQMDHSMALNKITPFPFNPNNLPAEQWSKLGLKDWQIKMIKKYEANGGTFRKKEDVKKMYCLKPSEYEVLEPYIQIPEQKKEFLESKPIPKEVKVPLMVELNTADSTTLTKLYGIGPSFARRIIKYRNLLGGFYSKTQLLEVYGFDQDRLDLIDAHCTINPDSINKIDINNIRTAELKKHPYFDFYTAKAIVDKRIILGKFTSMQQIKDIPYIREDVFNKSKSCHYFLNLEIMILSGMNLFKKSISYSFSL